MDKKTETQETQFHISLPDGPDQKDISKLLLWTAKELRGINEKKPIYVSVLCLQDSSADDDKPSIFVNFWYLDEDDLNLEKDHREYTKEYKVAPATQDVEYSRPLGEGTGLNSFTQRLPQGEDQGNSILLVERVAATVEELKGARIYDIVYHDFSDDDGLNHPFIRVYFENA